jgi:hypothetical protein
MLAGKCTKVLRNLYARGFIGGRVDPVTNRETFFTFFVAPKHRLYDCRHATSPFSSSLSLSKRTSKSVPMRERVCVCVCAVLNVCVRSCACVNAK